MVRILILALLFIPGNIHAADDITSRLKDLTKKAREIEGLYQSEEKKLKSIDEAVSKIQARITRMQESVLRKQMQIRDYDRQVVSYESELAKARERIRQQWVVLYKSASLDMVTVYYGHEKYAGYLNAVFKHHAETLHEYQTLKEKILTTREKADAVEGLLKRDLDELKQSAGDLEIERRKKAELISSLKGKKKEYQDEIENILKEIQRREREKREREKSELARKQKEKREKKEKEGREQEVREKEKKEQEPGEAAGGFARNRGRLMWPVKGKVVRGFGPYTVQGFVQRSQGMDIETQEGSAVRSVFSGKVVYASWMDRFGNTIILDHGDGFYSIYGHLQEFVKSPGQSVASQEVIARVGQTGNVLRPTLHFEIRYHQKAQDPVGWLIEE